MRVDEEPSGGKFQFVWRLLAAFSCTSNDRPTRRLSEENESMEVVLLKTKEAQKLRKIQHAENELKRLREQTTTGRLRVGLCLNDAFDVTIHNYDNNVSGETTLRWGNVFSNYQNLLHLNLSGIPMESDHLPAILKGVSENCFTLEVLVMPQQTSLTHRRRSVDNVIEAFHAALTTLDTLQRSRTGKRSRLTKLVLPWLFPNESVDATAAVIGKHCPELKYIEGIRLAAFSRRRRLTSVEMRQSSLHCWEAFCVGCTHLVALNWCSLPCSEEVFNIFSTYPKLELKSLVLPGNTALWRREYVLQERHHVEPLSPSNHYAPLLRGCPTLTKLEVLLSDMQGDSELLGDQFLRHVVDACPKLERLALVEASVHHGYGPSNAFTNEGLNTLKSLSHLRNVELSGVEFTERTILSLAARPRPPRRPRTNIDLTLGVRGWNVVDCATNFHEAVSGFLSILIASETREYPSFILRVRLDTLNYSPPALWEARFVSEWNKTKRELTWRAPNIKFNYDYIRAEATIECQALTTAQPKRFGAKADGRNHELYNTASTHTSEITSATQG
ncbi:hypothetical protein PHMEG_00025835 [Phytophthora megakarya]|uniref:Uncharacterized protein n=1 Tax=Phytophthora megakarya TaxID=4795 RepID=A0A225VCI1_9STRA|nr:hypothetical protein PHMEG_00025835 [Phytophthora megakarya]